MGSISDRWKTEKIDSLSISRMMALQKECKEGEKIGFICGIPSVVKMTPLEISLNSFLVKIERKLSKPALLSRQVFIRRKQSEHFLTPTTALKK